MSQLFNQMRDIGLQIQKDATDSLIADSALHQHSLEFLSAPRNALFLRWKPEARTTIVMCYERLKHELKFHNNGFFQREISAYELVEGADESLTSAFAELCGHQLAFNRMRNPSHAAYVAQWTTQQTARLLSVALSKLVYRALEYMQRHPPPASAGSREVYFASGGGVTMHAAPVHRPRRAIMWEESQPTTSGRY